MSLVYVTMPFAGSARENLEAVLPGAQFVYQTAPGYDTDVIANADVIIGNIPPQMLGFARNLKFFQLNSAGSNQYTVPGVLREDITLCNATGSYGLAISEYILTGILMMFKKMPKYIANQKQNLWQGAGTVRSIYGSTILIVGAGDIGGSLGERVKALGAYTIGVRRTVHEKSPYLDELYTMDALDDLLPRADAVVLSLPQTPATTNLMNREKFSLMKDDAILVNIGRGNCVVTEDLMEALNSHVIGGAVLDVTEPEPLPADHPLWGCDNLVITPPVSGGYNLPETLNRIQRLAIENLDAWVNDKPLKNLVDRETGYRIARD